MYLKRIEIKGFKSFADKIELDFENGITAVVGPNGSGKSNIADAIKWVLGEQSAKSLRGAKMEDVIFAGTEARGALGYAEVALVLDNQSKLINLSYSEIIVKRRLYRTGESEYSINGSKCRLKDVLEIFMDTGIGKDGYSLIGQGKVEEILSTRSEDRRNIFEEAAGIIKYKWRKSETEKRLENTKQNLLRVDDIIEELKLQIEPLESQSENAKKYLKYRDELKNIEVNLLTTNFLSIKEDLNNIEKEKNSFQRTKEENDRKKTILKNKIEHIKSRLDKIDLETVKTNKLIMDMEKLFENKQGTLKLLNERHDNIQKEKKRIEGEIHLEKDLINKEEIEVKELIFKNREAKDTLNDKESILLKLEIEFENIAKKCLENNSLIENKKSDIIQIIKELSDISNKESVYEANIKNLNNRKVQILKDKNVKEEKLISIEDNKTIVNESIESLSREIKELEKIIKEKTNNIILLEMENNDLNKNRNNIFSELKKKEARFFTLESMENDMEGFSRSVKSIIKEYSGSNDVFGTVNEIIEVPKGYESSIEIALMSSLQNIVVKNEDIAKNAIEFLKKNKLGRATFYPLTTIKERYINLSDEVKSIKGFKGIASDIISFDPMFKNIVKYLLGRVVICEDLNSSREIAKKTNYSVKIVTLDGDVINPGGSYTGGSNNYKNGGLISRKNEIKSLKDEIRDYKEKLNSIENNISIKITNIKALKEEENKLKNDFQTLYSKLNTENINKKSLEENISSINDDINGFLIELEQIENEILNNNNFNKNTFSEKNLMIENQVNLEKEINTLNISSKEDNKLKNDLQEETTKMKIEIGEIKKSIEVLEEKINVKSESKDTHERRINIFSNQIIDMNNKSLETQEETKLIIVEQQKISKQLIDMKNKVHKIEVLRKNIILKRDYSEKDLEKVEDTIKNLVETIYKFEVKYSKLEVEKENIIKKLWDDYELTIPEALKDKKDIVSLKEEENKVKKIKDTIKALGNININAIEEYKTINERYKFLSEQKEDLLNAEVSLVKIIEELTEKMSKQFKEKFKLMRENFNETFRSLFGGGHADLKIEGEDPLNSGIDIIVQPPGKKLQSLSLLSGGEKGLSAIALVFAILKMKPTPFCVLDEIEAALDDANVNRYAKFLKDYSDKTQFIIITHRKGSMAVAKSLYGVTMEEKGVSKIISLKLEGGI